jgi:hypothetical protein
VLPITSMMNTMMAARRTGSNQAYSGGRSMFGTELDQTRLRSRTKS